jgi:tetratricopeptide (TPR) repeat protein
MYRMGQIHPNQSRTGLVTPCVGGPVLALVVFFAPLHAHGQCQPLAAATVQSSSPQRSATTQPEFFDEPQFTVAGVTDTTNLGGHGSNTVARTKDALAKDVVSLGSPPAHADSINNANPSGGVGADSTEEGGSIKKNDPLETIREYQRAAETNPSESNFFNWGAELLLHHAIEPAIEVFTKGNRLFPQSSRMLVGLGVAWYASGSNDHAAQRLCEASDLNPADPNPYLFLGKIQSVETTQSEGLVQRLERFASLQPKNAQANYYYAVGLWKQRKNPDDASSAAKAESLLKKSISLDPNLGAAYLQLGVLRSDRKDFPSAIAAYQNAVEASAAMPEQEQEAHYRLAQVYRRTGEKVKAQQELQLYDQLAKQSAEQIERERHEVPQFVYTLRTPSSSASKPE